MKRLICFLAVLLLIPVCSVADIDESFICGVWVCDSHGSADSASLRVFQLLDNHVAYYVGKFYYPENTEIARPASEAFFTWEQSEDDYGYTIVISSPDSVYETLYFIDGGTLAYYPDGKGLTFLKAGGDPLK